MMMSVSLRVVAVVALAAGCAARPRAPIAHRVIAPPEPPAAAAAPRIELVEREMPELEPLPVLAVHPGPPPRDDTVMRDCLARVARFQGYRRSHDPIAMRAAVNHAIAIGGDCRLAADHTFGTRATRYERWGCGHSVYDDIHSAWQLAAAVATTPERRRTALHNRAILMWSQAVQQPAGAARRWIATAAAFERASVAAAGDRGLFAIAVDAWDNALRTLPVSSATRDDVAAIRAGLARAPGARAAKLLAILPR